MKVLDIAKLIDDQSEVFIYTESEYLRCMMGKDEWDCTNGDSEFGCGMCDCAIPTTSKWESYHGLGKDIPIKLGEKKVIGLNVKVRTFGRGRSKKDYPCLGIQVKEEER